MWKKRRQKNASVPFTVNLGLSRYILIFWKHVFSFCSVRGKIAYFFICLFQVAVLKVYYVVQKVICQVIEGAITEESVERVSQPLKHLVRCVCQL